MYTYKEENVKKQREIHKCKIKRLVRYGTEVFLACKKCFDAKNTAERNIFPSISIFFTYCLSLRCLSININFSSLRSRNFLIIYLTYIKRRAM